MTKKQLRRYIEIAGYCDPDCLEDAKLGFFCSHTTEEVLEAFDKLIDSEESAWQMLEELKAADVAQHQKHLKAALAAALTAHNPTPAGEA